MQFAFLNNNKYAAINAVKTAIGCSIAFILGKVLEDYFNVEQMYLWMVITVLVVMSTQPNLGGAIDKALMRFLGTIVSAVIAMVIVFISVDKYEMFALAICFVIVGVFIAGASSKYGYAGSLGAITLVVIILNKDASMKLAVFRMLEISQGIIIALLVNRFVYPIRAEVRLRESFAKNLKDTHSFFQILFDVSDEKREDYVTSIFLEFTKQISLIKEVGYEKRNIHNYQRMSLHSRRIYRYMIVIYEYVDANVVGKEREQLLQDSVFIEIRNECGKLLESLSHSLYLKEQIDLSQIQNFEDNLNNNFKDISLLSGAGNSILESSLKSFVLAIHQFSIEHNSLVLSK